MTTDLLFLLLYSCDVKSNQSDDDGLSELITRSTIDTRTGKREKGGKKEGNGDLITRRIIDTREKGKRGGMASRSKFTKQDRIVQ